MSGYKVLILGSGGREHAFAWSLSNDPLVEQLYCAPGNGGTGSIGENVPLDIQDPNETLKFVERNSIDLTIVGPEAPLEQGVVDVFKKNGKLIFGPTQYAAQLETSKVFARKVMAGCNVPQPCFVVCNTRQEVENAKSEYGLPVVVKVDGLAAGKGAYVCESEAEFENSLCEIYENRIFGSASDQVLVEQCLVGEELSVFAVCDGEDFVILNTAQDHKRIYDEDKGPNTGGMGAYSPTPLTNHQLMDKVCRDIYTPVLKSMVKDGNPFTGFLYAGLMLVEGDPYVIEFNVRMGDPETQVVLPLLQSSLFELLFNSVTGKLAETKITTSTKTAVTVVLASDGYPGKYSKGQEITGLEADSSNLVFHAGTKSQDGKTFVNGGRVLNVVGFGNDLESAIENSYQIIDKIHFDGMYYRKDIGQKGMKYLTESVEEEVI